MVLFVTLILFQFWLSQFNPVVWRVTGRASYHNLLFQSPAIHITEPKMALTLAVIDLCDFYTSQLPYIFISFIWFHDICLENGFVWSTCTFVLKIKFHFLAPCLAANNSNKNFSNTLYDSAMHLAHTFLTNSNIPG